MKKILLAIICMVSGLCGCSDSDSGSVQQTDSIALSKELISLGFEGGTDEVVVTSSGDWRMSGSSAWAHPSVTEGKSGDTIVFTIDPNASDSNLQSEFKIFTGSAVARLTVTCGEGYVLSLSSDAEVSVMQAGGEFAVRLTTNIPQEDLTCTFADGGDSWIGDVEYADVFGDLLLTFTVSENNDYSIRSSVLSITGHDLSVDVAVSQQQTDFLDVLGEKVFEFESLEATSFRVDVESNIEYTVTTPEWITYEKTPATRALSTDRLTFYVGEGMDTRSGNVVIADADKRFEYSIAVRQIAPGIQMITIPDKNFRLKLRDNGWIKVVDEDASEVIPVDLEEIKKNDYYYDILRVNGADIESVEGIDNFPWITQCNLNTNNLTTVDISGLELVKTLNVGGNALLSEIICGSNACTINHDTRFDISLLTLSGCITSINLTAYYLSGDQLKELDVTQCPDLTSINGKGRNLTTIYITAEQQGRITLSNSSAEFVVR